MNDSNSEYLTKEKYKELQEELENLKKNRRKELAEDLQYARSLGDLSENAEYHEARDEQAKVEGRIKYIENILKNASLVSSSPKKTEVFLGSKVTIKNQKTEEVKQYNIVGTEESDISNNKISHLSPLGKAIMGKKKREDFYFITPSGEKRGFKIIEIE